MDAQNKISEAKAKFQKGTKFISVSYPQWQTMNEQVDDEIHWNKRMPNFLWVKAKTPMGLTMLSVIYDANTDTWAKNEVFKAKPAKALTYVNPLQIKKGDGVMCNDGRKGTIVGYPSNSAIVIEDSMGVKFTVNKNDIKLVMSHAN